MSRHLLKLSDLQHCARCGAAPTFTGYGHFTSTPQGVLLPMSLKCACGEWTTCPTYNPRDRLVESCDSEFVRRWNGLQVARTLGASR